MKGLGVLLISIGAALVIVFLTMDTSVETELGGRVNNMGLMNSRSDGIMIGMGTFLAGILFVGFGSMSPKSATVARPGRLVGSSEPRDVTESDLSLWADLPLLDSHPNGEDWVRGTRREDGSFDGPFVRYWSDGGLDTRGVWRDGKLHGPFTACWRSGQVRESGLYHEGEKCGDWFDRGQTNRYDPCPSSSSDEGDPNSSVQADRVEGPKEPVSDPPPPGPSTTNVYDDLRQLGALRDSGVLTDEEFERKKQELLDRI